MSIRLMLARDLADHCNLNSNEAKTITHRLLSRLAQEIRTNNKTEIRGLGTFRSYMSPETKKYMFGSTTPTIVPAKRRIRFRVSPNIGKESS